MTTRHMTSQMASPKFPRVAAAMASRDQDPASRLALNDSTLARIQQICSYPAVTILMSSGPTTRSDQMRLDQLIESASVRLLTEFSRPVVQPLLDRLVGLASHVETGPGRQSIALFASADFAASVSLPMAVRDRAMVDETFATRDLVHALLRSPHYDVLVLANVVRLYEGVGANLNEVVGRGFPLLSTEGYAEPTRFGVDPSDTRDAGLRRYLRAVDTALTGHLRKDRPFLLVGSGRRLSLFRQHSRHRSHLTAMLPGTFEHGSAIGLADTIWPAITGMFDRCHRAACFELDRAAGARRYAVGIQQVWAMTNRGRGAHVVVEENFAYPARIDHYSDNLAAAVDIAHPEVVDDVVDEIIEIVQAKGGRATIVPDGTLASRGRIAMALRY